jgi:hypothetical protein
VGRRGRGRGEEEGAACPAGGRGSGGDVEVGGRGEPLGHGGGGGLGWWELGGPWSDEELRVARKMVESTTVPRLAWVSRVGFFFFERSRVGGLVLVRGAYSGSLAPRGLGGGQCAPDAGRVVVGRRQEDCVVVFSVARTLSCSAPGG